MSPRTRIRCFLAAETGGDAGGPCGDAVPADARPQTEDTFGAVEPGWKCDVAVLFALPNEAGGLVDLLRGRKTIRAHRFRLYRGTLRGRRVVVAESGAGEKPAADAAAAVIEGHRPNWVISAGFAGGLVPHVERNHIAVPDCVVRADNEGPELALPAEAAGITGRPAVHVGRLLTADRVVRSPDEKAALGKTHGAIAVDMETYAVVEVCRRRDVRVLAVRAVTDAVDDELPHEVQHLVRQKTRVARFGAALRALWKRPANIKDLWRLKETALVASDRLAQFLADAIENLVPPTPASHDGE